jgi:hypothetical protein
MSIVCILIFEQFIIIGLFLLQHDGMSTLQQPPNTHSFDPTNQQRSLHPSHQAPSCVVLVPGSQTSNIGACLQLMTQMVDVIVPASVPAPSMPHNSSRSATSLITPTNLSPPLPTSSDILQYLKYASEKLGVRSAENYVSLLKWKSYGPDILSQVPNSDLAGLGIPPGDIIRLKNGSDRWWKKQKKNQAHEDDLDASLSNQGGSISRWELPQNNEDDKVGYEYKYPDGGGVHYSRPCMMHGNQGPHDCCTTY